jgi:hypothetical protein
MKYRTFRFALNTIVVFVLFLTHNMDISSALICLLLAGILDELMAIKDGTK